MKNIIHSLTLVGVIFSINVHAQISATLDTLKHIDSNQLCFGYYITDDSQKIAATFVINNNPSLTNAQRIEQLEHSVTILLKDNVVKELLPTEIKSYTIEHWKCQKLLSVPSFTITDTSREFTSIPVGKHFWVGGRNPEGIPYQYTQGVLFLSPYRKEKYPNTFYCWWTIHARQQATKYLSITLVHAKQN